MKYKALIIVFGVLIVTLSFSFGYYAFVKEMKREKLPEIGLVHHFELTDSDGMAYNSERLLGKVWIANFFFTTCGTICPTLSKNMAALHRTFELVDGISLVSFTVNPETDTPPILKQYAKKYKANTKKWAFLTGPRERIEKLAREDFKLGSVDEPVFHSGHITLIDRSGYIRGYYDGLDQKRINELFKDASKLLKERF